MTGPKNVAPEPVFPPADSLHASLLHRLSAKLPPFIGHRLAEFIGWWRRFETRLTPHPRGWWVMRGTAAALALLAILLCWLAVTAPLGKSLEPIAPPRLTLLAANGEAIARSGAIIDAPVRAMALPPHVKQAFMAIEDRRFESHWGIDPRGIARATLANFSGGGVRQGGSTITQQLAKITFLTPDRSLSRKAQEVLIAFWLETRLSKGQIMERYLSNVYFGDNIYGLRAASMRYFYRQPERLTLAQAALLAGLVQAPSRLAPTRNPAAARKRARMVLNAMADCGFISRAKAVSTRDASLDLGRVRERDVPKGTYFADWAMPQARAQAEGGYGDEKIRTTLDARLQRIAEQTTRRAGLGDAQVALVAMRPDGEIVAMVGGRDYAASTFNRATMARRQPGSTFKLFVYLAALRQGMTPDTMIDDLPISTGNYRPRNSGDHYAGRITLRQAFARSSNVAAVRLYQRLGPVAIFRAARDLGVNSRLDPTPSVALGSSAMTLLELTSAYAGVATNRWPVKPHAIAEQGRGYWWNRLWDGKRSFDRDVHEGLLDLLGAVVTQGTGRRAALNIKTYGKTGTSQNNRDAYFVGFADDLVAGVWIGKDDDTPLRGISGGGLPAQIWRDFMKRAVKGGRHAESSPSKGRRVEVAIPDAPMMPEVTDDIPTGPAPVTDPLSSPDAGAGQVPVDSPSPASADQPQPPAPDASMP